MAGGKGTRLWPKSRKTLPKQFMPITGHKTLLQQTVDRLSTFVHLEHLYVVTTPEYAQHVREQIPAVNVDHIIIEPCQHSTTASLAYILLSSHVLGIAADDVIVILPTDAYIQDTVSFVQCLENATELAADTGGTVTIGVPTTYPSTHYGYIQTRTQTVGQGFKVHQFVEKPDLETARQYMQDNSIYWNSGIFIWKLSTLEELVQVHLPTTYREITRLTPHWQELDDESLRQWYIQQPKQSFEYTLVERTTDIYMVPATFKWTDLGTWSSFIETLSSRRTQDEAPVVMHESHRCLVESERGLVALFGVDDLIVVQTGDTLLVCSRDHEDQLKQLVDFLSERNYDNYL
ncbi:mannose-1-phosphate guanylyltransferase [Alicyclobacillus sp. ALC3]|uniref:mannose-1-phosphate guanylyltransferase n=1 Tax=Alicyclobacillus sp. ALC3 TaxID=2796143 RepID=UPI00237924A8|nr:sugar phosphate nucleotidyltransferase [Alicyclobacillus sp. ALC3]WDL95148.1 mannose-1-phosphate guanylyltransferase [Alicyclobacillus sp. ALC3]